MKNKTVILIGSEGLIGKNFKNFLIKKNFNILCLDIKNKPIHKVSNKIIYLKKNVNNPKALLEAIKYSDKKFGGIDYVIDCSYPSMIVDRKTKRNNYQLLKKSISNNIASPIMICEIFCEYFKNKKKKWKFNSFKFYSRCYGSKIQTLFENKYEFSSRVYCVEIWNSRYS